MIFLSLILIISIIEDLREINGKMEDDFEKCTNEIAKVEETHRIFKYILRRFIREPGNDISRPLDDVGAFTRSKDDPLFSHMVGVPVATQA